MRILFALLIVSLFLNSCSHLNRLSDERITGKKNMIFFRPFSGASTPDEVIKLISDQFYTKLTKKDYFSGRNGKTYNFDFYMGQQCPAASDCYYITGEVSNYKYEQGCCGRDGVKVKAVIKFWNDLTKKPLFEVSESNNEVFESEDMNQLQAIEVLAEDTAHILVNELLDELQYN
ncbi:MAG: hypothetical protein OEV42_09650 [Deltaproteobacteria bacterium]|nr:hypothetical protein [Deltaproteobacteria bacterium]